MTWDRFSPDQQTVLRTIERLAGELGTPVYFVGGVVRDLLLERSILDVDLAVEGEATALARQAAAILPVDLRTHEEFGTAALLTVGGRRVDLASTRREEYPAVAALPTVSPAALDDDLIRRDFTVNSMALPLGAPETTCPIDPAGGRKDLESRRLRVHHERSFLDDPTRILRGVRFELRLAFELGPATERLAREACAAGAVARLSADRLRAELELLFEEEFDPEPAWERLTDLGVLPAAGLRAGAAASVLLGRVRRSLAGWSERHGEAHRVERSRALLAAVVLAEAPERRAAAAGRLGIPAGSTERFEDLTATLERDALLPHEAAEALQKLPLEELVLVEAVGGPRAGARVQEHLRSQRRFELQIDGSTLLDRGFAAGPRIGEALRATRRARLDGLITAGEELALAVALLRGENRGA